MKRLVVPNDWAGTPVVMWEELPPTPYIGFIENNIRKYLVHVGYSKYVIAYKPQEGRPRGFPINRVDAPNKDYYDGVEEAIYSIKNKAEKIFVFDTYEELLYWVATGEDLD